MLNDPYMNIHIHTHKQNTLNTIIHMHINTLPKLHTHIYTWHRFCTLTNTDHTHTTKTHMYTNTHHMNINIHYCTHAHKYTMPHKETCACLHASQSLTLEMPTSMTTQLSTTTWTFILWSLNNILSIQYYDKYVPEILCQKISKPSKLCILLLYQNRLR